MEKESTNHVFFENNGINYVYFTRNNLIAEVEDIKTVERYYYDNNLDYNEKDIHEYFQYNTKKILNEISAEKIFDSAKLNLTICLTNNCSLRCKYCIYSGAYKNERQHSNESMTISTIEDVLRFVKRSYKKIKVLNVAFYGGEPTLCSESIMKLIEIANKYFQIEINYSIATNGIRIPDNLLKIFKKNKFEIQISLDGPQVVNDKYRVDANNNGSFDLIIESIQRMKKIGIEDISFACTLAPPFKLNERYDFFSNTEFVKNSEIIFGWLVYNDNFYNSENNQYDMRSYLKAFEEFIEKTDNLDNDFHKAYFFQQYKYIHTRVDKDIFSENEIARSFCKFGNSRLFVDVNGCFSPCEQLTSCKIGNVHDGFDIERIMKTNKEYLNYRISNCSKCWAVRLCFYCQSGYYDDKMYNDSNSCDKMRAIIKESLGKYSYLYSKNPVIFKELLKSW